MDTVPVFMVSCHGISIFLGNKYLPHGRMFALKYGGFILWPVAFAFITVTLKWSRWCLESPSSWLFAQPFVQAHIKENSKAPRHWPLWGEPTGHRWIPLIKGQQCGKCFHLMTSLWIICNNYLPRGGMFALKYGVLIILWFVALLSHCKPLRICCDHVPDWQC